MTFDPKPFKKIPYIHPCTNCILDNNEISYPMFFSLGDLAIECPHCGYDKDDDNNSRINTDSFSLPIDELIDTWNKFQRDKWNKRIDTNRSVEYFVRDLEVRSKRKLK